MMRKQPSKPGKRWTVLLLLPLLGLSMWLFAKPSYIRATDVPLMLLDDREISHLTNINTETIESISVLKDASATGLYGDNGKHRVIIIKSKPDTEQKIELG